MIRKMICLKKIFSRKFKIAKKSLLLILLILKNKMNLGVQLTLEDLNLYTETSYTDREDSFQVSVFGIL